MRYNQYFEELDKLEEGGQGRATQALINCLQSIGLLKDLRPDAKWIIHHANKDQNDNSVENLWLIPFNRHSSYHGKKKFKDLTPEDIEDLRNYEAISLQEILQDLSYKINNEVNQQEQKDKNKE